MKAGRFPGKELIKARALKDPERLGRILLGKRRKVVKIPDLPAAADELPVRRAHPDGDLVLPVICRKEDLSFRRFAGLKAFEIHQIGNLEFRSSDFFLLHADPGSGDKDISQKPAFAGIPDAQFVPPDIPGGRLRVHVKLRDRGKAAIFSPVLLFS